MGKLILLDRDNQRAFGLSDRIELDYWTIVRFGADGRQEIAAWSVKELRWQGQNPALSIPQLQTMDDSPVQAVFLPSNPEIARPQTFESLEFYLRPKTDGGLTFMSHDREIAHMARGTGEWIIDPGFSYEKVVFTAVGFEVPEVPFTPQPRSRLSPLAERRASRSAGRALSRSAS